MHSVFNLVLAGAIAATTPPAPDPGDAAYQKQDWAAAAAAYRKLTASEPERGMAWFRFGRSLVQLGQGKEAIPPLEKAQKLGVYPLVVQYQLAQASALAGDKKRALSLLQALADEDFYPAGPPAKQEKAFASLHADPEFEKLSAQMEINRAPCQLGNPASPYRQFDFWLGEWNVFDQAGNPVGTSRIERILGECVLLENWKGLGGGEGKSFNTWNPGQKRWEQYWVDGVPIFFEGHLKDGEMRFRSDGVTRTGARKFRRLTFSKLSGGRVRQFSEASPDDGRSWAPESDFVYVPKGAPAKN